MSKVFTDVSVFMNAVNQSTPSYNVKSSSQADLYFSLIQEEYGELINGILKSNDIEICDACFDLMWVIIGYMKSRGWDCENIWDEGAKSNLSKIDRVTGLVKRREDGKILKPDDWKPPNFTNFVK